LAFLASLPIASLDLINDSKEHVNPRATAFPQIGLPSQQTARAQFASSLLAAVLATMESAIEAGLHDWNTHCVLIQVPLHVLHKPQWTLNSNRALISIDCVETDCNVTCIPTQLQSIPLPLIDV
jgi:hypothetical protein